MCWGSRYLGLEGFYGAIAVIVIGVIAFLYQVIWRKAEDRIKDLNGAEGQQGTIWLGDIWMTDIKQGVQDFYMYVDTNIAKLESEDKFVELFAHTGKKPELRKKLQELSASYQKFVDCSSLLSKLRKSHETTKIWTLRTIVMLIILAALGPLGLLVDNTFLASYNYIYWICFGLILFFILIFSAKLAKCYTRCCTIDNDLTDEKSKHSDALGVIL
jgi:hypothetical protein